ncbi:MAG: hypothetical protein KC543_05550 [Myxococcales bacterium]|nr:hypothetical protein [Myxococcales bacterium]
MEHSEKQAFNDISEVCEHFASVRNDRARIIEHFSLYYRSTLAVDRYFGEMKGNEFNIFANGDPDSGYIGGYKGAYDFATRRVRAMMEMVKDWTDQYRIGNALEAALDEARIEWERMLDEHAAQAV